MAAKFVQDCLNSGIRPNVSFVSSLEPSAAKSPIGSSSAALSINRPGLGDKGLAALCSSGAVSHSLEAHGCLTLTNCGVTEHGLLPLRECMQNMCDRGRERDDTRINLSGNAIGFCCAWSVQPMLAVGAVVELRLSGVRLRCSGMLALLRAMCGEVPSDAAADVATGSRRLWERAAASLICGSKTSSVDALTKGRETHALHLLDISGNEIREAGAKAAAAMVVLGSQLSHLDISNNALGAIGGAAVAAAMGRSSSLQVLVMKAAGVERSVSMALANAIAECQCIQSLDVSSNRIDDICAILLAFSLRHNSSITRMDFSSTWLGASGCRALLRALRFKQERAPSAASSDRSGCAFEMILNDAICSGSSGGTSVDFDDPNGDYALDLADPCDRAVAAELWEAAVRGEAGQENWRGEAIDGRTINISESANEPWKIPLEGELTVYFTSYPKTPAVDAVLADVHLIALIKMMKVMVMEVVVVVTMMVMVLLVMMMKTMINQKDAGHATRISEVQPCACYYSRAVCVVQATCTTVAATGRFNRQVMMLEMRLLLLMKMVLISQIYEKKLYLNLSIISDENLSECRWHALHFRVLLT